jgi:hypothetical protein
MEGSGKGNFGYLFPSMRALAVGILLLTATLARAAERIILIPLDSRPAAGQFAQMIARMASCEVVIPPTELLGRFTKPGSADGVLDWLAAQDLSKVHSVVVSTDMVTYGGLVASRVNDTSEPKAVERLRRLRDIRRKYPEVKFYGFSAIMRLFPTSTRSSASWRVQLGRFAELKDRYRRSKDPALQSRIMALQAKIPPLEIVRYETARERNFKVQQRLIRMNAENTFDYLILGQDDAQPYGPHILETQRLRELTDSLHIAGKTYFCEGVDQLSNILVSRALLRKHAWTPRVRVVLSDDAAKKKVANYESKNIELSLRDQLLASGARPWLGTGDYDFTLWLNVPDPRESLFQKFTSELVGEVDQGFPAGVADINLGKSGTADPRLFDKLWEQNRMIRLLAYAGWNTAGNTMGTSIPAANVYLLARRLSVDPLKRELAQREFVLHRFVNDFAYHKYTRPEAYKLIDSMARASREETYGEEFATVNDFVRRDMEKHLQKFYAEQFLGKTFFAGTRQYRISGLEGVKVGLPWPRAYEVRLDFRLQAEPL